MHVLLKWCNKTHWTYLWLLTLFGHYVKITYFHQLLTKLIFQPWLLIGCFSFCYRTLFFFLNVQGLEGSGRCGLGKETAWQGQLPKQRALPHELSLAGKEAKPLPSKKVATYEETSLDIIVCLRIQTALRGLRIKSRASVNCPLSDALSQPWGLFPLQTHLSHVAPGPLHLLFSPFFHSLTFVIHRIVQTSLQSTLELFNIPQRNSDPISSHSLNPHPEP